MSEIIMRVISEPEPGTRSVIHPNTLPVFTGDGSTDYLCGNCGGAIASGMHDNIKFSGLVVLCTCGSYNEMQGAITMKKPLKNKPLVEAIFELRWELSEGQSGVHVDPHYRILVGGIYNGVKEEYPFHEQLLTATMPDEISGYVVQHRFRKGEEEWPLIQIGPGIITLNETDGYLWEDFERRVSDLLDVFFETYPDPVVINRLLLRYIDSVDFNYGSSVFDFLKEKMKVGIDVDKELFAETGVSDLPLGIDLRFSFRTTTPKGAIHLKFARGRSHEAGALVWETMVQSAGNDAPKARDEITKWIEKAHDLTHNWFFKTIDGELRGRFE